MNKELKFYVSIQLNRLPRSDTYQRSRVIFILVMVFRVGSGESEIADSSLRIQEELCYCNKHDHKHWTYKSLTLE